MLRPYCGVTQGTLLLATTNHPEIIDDRVMKRSGRLDRVFIIPELNDNDVAEKMLREYLGEDWRDAHIEIVSSLCLFHAQTSLSYMPSSFSV